MSTYTLNGTVYSFGSTIDSTSGSSSNFSISSVPVTKTGTNYSGNTSFTLNDNNTLTFSGNGMPYPAKAGTPDFVNDGITTLSWYYPGTGTAYLGNQNYNITFPYRGGKNVESLTSTSLGMQGMFANGAALFSPGAAPGLIPDTNLNFGVYSPCAPFFETVLGVDEGGGHSAPLLGSSTLIGRYHYHDAHFLTTSWNNETFWSSNSYYNDTSYDDDHFRSADGHSKIIGVLFDGYPIYGPYGYTDATDSSSGVTRMTSSYKLNDTEFSGRPYKYTDTGFFYGDDPSNPTTITVSAGAFILDYYYADGSGNLDQCNGRYCVTPEYPNGTYAYFATVDDEGEGVFPYMFGFYSKNTRNIIDNSNPDSTTAI